MSSAENQRKGMYAKIAIARKQLGMDEETYREKLQNEYGVSSAKDLNVHQLARLVQAFVALGVTFTTKARDNAQPAKPYKWIEITDSMPHAGMKRQILLIWKKLGYTTEGLAIRCERQFGTPVFVWIHDHDKLKAFLTDLQKREHSFDKKKAATA